jgi:hypothetical protein
MREKKILKLLKKALKNEHLYSDDELHYMKTEVNNLEKVITEQIKKSSKGFGH